MGEGRKVLVVIPARGGSKRLPRKNILPLGNKPLIAWTIEAALASGIADKVVVSSDDEEILAAAELFGANTMLRDPSLADDNAKTVDVLLDVILRERAQGFLYSDIILLQPTSPLRASYDIEQAYKKFLQRADETVVSVCEVDHPIQWCGSIAEDGEFKGVDFLTPARSQDLPRTYRLNGAIYIVPEYHVVTTKLLYTNRVNAYVMPTERSIDIDTHVDFTMCASIVGCARDV
ncbi:acylneuraminate cytidylyltransferase family protein [Pseudomonas putida]|uniref:acylneuraminate cytidylyltransferase family protein n=1 Tax=Pseudomonas putida TaxID=303 RepID=UPI001059E205|nr:acylneuraminate cytidylyltransferase family protein [Pseudomonas putida]TDJ74430.1 acylneuraminate cytidylyltransferase family protein [Pseudomonas putida]